VPHHPSKDKMVFKHNLNTGNNGNCSPALGHSTTNPTIPPYISTGIEKRWMKRNRRVIDYILGIKPNRKDKK